MITSPKGQQFIKDREAFRSVAYLPTPDDRWTVGYGFTEIDGRPVVSGDTVTRAEADRRFPEIVAEYEDCVAVCVASVPTTQNQFNAMVSLCFNIGKGRRPGEKGKDGFRTSSVLRAHLRGDYSAAARAFGLWNKQAGKVVDGLTSRRALESVVYLEPDVGSMVQPMPQTVDAEPRYTASGINKGGIVGGAVTTLAGVQPVLDAVNAFKTGTDSLGTWIVPVLLLVVLGTIGYMLYGRWQLRKQGQA